MTNDQDITLGEIGRAVARIESGLFDLRAEVRDRSHKLTNDLNVAAGTASRLSVQVENQQFNLTRHENALGELHTKVDAAAATAHRVSGAGAVLAVLVGLIPWPWKH